jgi:hypothetical protein
MNSRSPVRDRRGHPTQSAQRRLASCRRRSRHCRVDQRRGVEQAPDWPLLDHPRYRTMSQAFIFGKALSRVAHWQTMRVPSKPDYLAPDGSEMCLGPSAECGGVALCSLSPGKVTRAVKHKRVACLGSCSRLSAETGLILTRPCYPRHQSVRTRFNSPVVVLVSVSGKRLSKSE